MNKTKEAVLIDSEDPTRKWDIRIDENGQLVKMVEQKMVLEKGKKNG